MEQEYTIHNQRDENRNALQFFSIGMNYTIDYRLDKLFDDCITAARELINEAIHFKLPPEAIEEIMSSQGDHKALVEHSEMLMAKHYSKVNYLEAELLALAEIKILYAYKHIEIKLKSLLKIGYPDVDTKAFYQWDNFLSFIKGKGITVSLLAGYEEVDQLRKVNNALKHEGLINDKINKITEFFGEDDFTYLNLTEFYSRVQSAGYKFVDALSNAIFDDRFVFNEEKMLSLVNSIVLRMDKETAEDFAVKLIEKYNCPSDN